jgi:hypothetical protein
MASRTLVCPDPHQSRKMEQENGNLSYLDLGRAFPLLNYTHISCFLASVTREWTIWPDGGREPKSNSRFNKE